MRNFLFCPVFTGLCPIIRSQYLLQDPPSFITKVLFSSLSTLLKCKACMMLIKGLYFKDRIFMEDLHNEFVLDSLFISQERKVVAVPLELVLALSDEFGLKVLFKEVSLVNHFMKSWFKTFLSLCSNFSIECYHLINRFAVITPQKRLSILEFCFQSSYLYLLASITFQSRLNYRLVFQAMGAYLPFPFMNVSQHILFFFIKEDFALLFQARFHLNYELLRVFLL